MVTGKANKDLTNSNGDVKENMKCEILDVWLNNTANDIYVKVKFIDNNLEMITSISNIEILKK